MTEDSIDVGQWCHNLATELFPICRSITGNGVRQTLRKLASLLNGFSIHEVPSGTRCLDWTVPDEWNITDAYIITPNGRKICDFQRNNLHVLGYSEPVHLNLTREELLPHLYSRPEQPDAIPYVTSYYKRRWGFCLTQRELDTLPAGSYEVVINSTLSPGHLTYGELLIPGESKEEVFLSTYICHPSMGNNELSGPCVTTALARWINSLPNRRYTYRIVFVPETIGSIVYISRNLETLKDRVIAGFVVNCCGDERAYSYLPTRLGNTLSDRIALHVMRQEPSGFIHYSYRDRGSDERQYCSPGVDLPMASIMRSKYGSYPEYHSSMDDLSFITPRGLAGGFERLRFVIEGLERNRTYCTTILGEPNLGSRGLYPTLSQGGSASAASIRNMMDLLAYCDGKHDLLQIADIIGCPIWHLYDLVNTLKSHGLIVDLVSPIIKSETK